MDSTIYQQVFDLCVSSGADSRRGVRRQSNQDAFQTDEYQRMFVVADGVAGNGGGEIASTIACGQILEVFDAMMLQVNADDAADRHEAITTAIRTCFQAADRRIVCERTMEPLLSEMATTALFAYVDTYGSGEGECEERLYLGNAGDSRALLIRGGDATQLTNDHTIAAGLRNAGILSEHEIAQHPGQHLLYMNLGGGLCNGPEICSCDVFAGDRIVLMTDGLTKVLHNDNIADVVMNASDAQVAAVNLVDEAIRQGAGDDVTCVVVELH